MVRRYRVSAQRPLIWISHRARWEQTGLSEHGKRPTTGADRPGAGLRQQLIRRLWLALALFFVGLGSVGAVLPLLPTTPFLLLAAFCASRSSPALHAWLYSHPRFGPLLRDWRDHRAIRPRAKVTALILVALSWVWMWVSVEPLYARLAASAVMAGVVVFLATRPHGPRGSGAGERRDDE